MINTKWFSVVLLLGAFIPNSLQLVAECEYKISHGWKAVGEPSGEEDPYGCFISTFNINSKTTLSGTTGKHLYGNTNDKVNAFNVYGGICGIIPAGIGSIYPNIEALSVWNATLRTVSNTDLQQFANLREIWIYENHLEFLPSSLFEYNPKIEYINFKSNAIKYIGENFFNYLPNLKRAEFWYNVCINDEATDAAGLEAIKTEIKKKCSLCGTLDGASTCSTGSEINSDAKGTLGTFSAYGPYTNIADVETLHFMIGVLRHERISSKGTGCAK